MNINENKLGGENKMGTMPVGKLLFNMGTPMVASMLFQAFYNIVDSIFVAMIGQDALNAVSLAFPLQSLCIALAGGTGVGINALLSRSLGAGDFKKADKAANVGIYLNIITAIVFAVFGYFLARPFFRFQTSNDAIISYGTVYVRIVLGFSIALFMQFCTERLLQSTGQMKLSMITQIVGASLNLVLDPILIFGLLGMPRMEVAGAALATVIGQAISAVVGFVLNVKHNKEIHLHIREIRPDRMISAEIYKVGIPSIVMQSIGSIMTLTLNKILIGFTEAATAAFGAYFKIQSFIFMPVFGLNNAMIPIVSYNYGAKKMDRVKSTVKLTIIVSVSIMTAGMLAFELIPNLLLNLFTPTKEMLEVGISAFRIIGIHFPVAGFCIIAGAVCQSLQKPVYALITSVCRQLVVLLPAAYLLSLTGNLNLVWFAFPIAEVASLIMNIFFLRSTYKSANITL